MVEQSEAVNIQVLVGGNIQPGSVVLLVYNCPTVLWERSKDDIVPIPGLRMDAEKAIELGNNLIHYGQMSQESRNG